MDRKQVTSICNKIDCTFPVSDFLLPWPLIASAHLIKFVEWRKSIEFLNKKSRIFSHSLFMHVFVLLSRLMKFAVSKVHESISEHKVKMGTN